MEQQHYPRMRRGNQKTKYKYFLTLGKKQILKRKYTKIEVGDMVRTAVAKTTFKKGYDSSWSKDVYKIRFIKDNQYLLSGDTRRRVWNRFELLKIEGAEGKNG
jgi:hypothetical protein